MGRVKRRATYYLLSISVLIMVSSVAYDLTMRRFEPGRYPPEGADISLLHSMQVVVETFTATGYGSDSPWVSPEANMLVTVLDLTGVALFFVALPAVLVPLFKETLSQSVPTEIPDDLRDHIVICTYTPRAKALIEELNSREVPYVVVEPDSERAIEIEDDGYSVVCADPESVSELQRLNLANARALVADVSDRVDASIVLAAREADEQLTVISVVEDPTNKPYHELAGADQVLTPRRLLGEGLAQKIAIDTSTELGEDFEIMEVLIHKDEGLLGTTLAESQIREQFGVNVIGAWFRGDFEAPPPPDRRFERGTVLLVTGTPTQLEAFATDTRSVVRRPRRGETVIVGHGEVGGTVSDVLEENGLPYTVVDQTDGEGVDVVGDGTDREVLEAAGVPDARSVVLAIPDDTTTEFATLAVRNLNDTAEILARADESQAVRKTYRAGADYVLSLATVSGRSIASAAIGGEEVLSAGSSVKIVRTTSPALGGKSLEEAAVRERTGVTVVAIERNGELVTGLDADFRIDADDTLVVAGSDRAVNEFIESTTESD